MQCNATCDEEEQKKRLTQWCGKVFDEMNGEIEARRHVERTNLDDDRCKNETIRSWILRALKLKWKLKKTPYANIRKNLNGWELNEIRLNVA